jgi:sugar phosphate isomerase/epimerase
MHPRIAVSAVSSWEWTPAEDLAYWHRAGIDHVGLSVTKLERAGWDESVAGLPVDSLRYSSVGTVGYFALDRPDRWAKNQARIHRAQQLAATLGAESTIVVSGGAGRLHWEQAAQALGRALSPVLEDGPALGVPALILENTTSQRPDYSFVHTLRDAADLVEGLGMGLCVEVNSCWAERGLPETLRRHIELVRLVQVSDFVIGSASSPDRAALGDGDIPFEWIIATLLEAGYTGSFEIELIGPRIEALGYEAAISRSVGYLSALLHRLGA